MEKMLRKFYFGRLTFEEFNTLVTFRSYSCTFLPEYWNGMFNPMCSRNGIAHFHSYSLELVLAMSKSEIKIVYSAAREQSEICLYGGFCYPNFVRKMWEDVWKSSKYRWKLLNFSLCYILTKKYSVQPQ